MKFNLYTVFDEPNRFPWDAADLSYPTYGRPYSYVCKAVARFANDQEGFLNGNPSMFELGHYADKNEGVARDIFRYFSREEVRDDSTPKQVLRFLCYFDPFTTWFEQKLSKMVMGGRIEVPKSWIYEVIDEWA